MESNVGSDWLVGGGVAALVFGAGVGIGVRVGALAVGAALTGHCREWGLCVL